MLALLPVNVIYNVSVAQEIIMVIPCS